MRSSSSREQATHENSKTKTVKPKRRDMVRSLSKQGKLVPWLIAGVGNIETVKSHFGLRFSLADLRLFLPVNCE
ncbi:MAG: hypothetical protein ACPHJ3_18370 [Rubripirellula sp.]